MVSTVPPPASTRKLSSQLLKDDADLRDIVEEFVNDLNTRLQELCQAHEALDWERLSMLAHRLKGASGSYGYPDLSHLAAEMEQSFHIQQADNFEEWITRFAELIGAAKNGLSES
ncbi:MAG: Hpt domain-containing protein [Planctomycetota bacterium]